MRVDRERESLQDGAMNAAILAIGTELSLGQIVNRNASWLAARLHELGLFTPYHRVVPDDRAMMVAEMRDLAGKVEVLVVTGGLGPTTDDFTRDAIAEFLGLPLEWDEGAWTWIQERLQERGVAVRDFQRQQCYFPKGYRLLHNDRGTAHGFRLETPAHNGPLRHVIVLPGPPAEVESAFTNGVRPLLEPLKATLDPLELRIWECLGVGESDVADRAEKALVGCPFEKAYRVHLPYVEFKLLYPFSKRREAEPWCAKVDVALGEWVALRGGEDAAENLFAAIAKLAPQRLLLVDRATEGHFMGRIATALKTSGLGDRMNLLSSKIAQREGDLELEVVSTDGLQAEIHVNWQGLTKSSHVTAPQKAAALSERRKQYFMECALLFWAREIRNF